MTGDLNKKLLNIKTPQNNALEPSNFAGMPLASASVTPAPLGASASQTRLRAKFAAQRGVKWQQ